MFCCFCNRILPSLSPLACLGFLAIGLCGCNTLEGKVLAGAWGATALAAQSPAHEVEQIYYLGVFDPHEQVPPSVYRVRVRGQASFMSTTNFASGWVHASLVDSLGTSMTFNNDTGSWNVSKIEERETAQLKTGRRQMLFGPMGFREAPADHRLCIVMGANPDRWFQAMDEALGVVADAVSEKRVGQLKSEIFDAIATAKAEQTRLADLEKRVESLKPQSQPANTVTSSSSGTTNPAPAAVSAADPPDVAPELTQAAVTEEEESQETAEIARATADEGNDTAEPAKEGARKSRRSGREGKADAAETGEVNPAVVTSNIAKYKQSREL